MTKGKREPVHLALDPAACPEAIAYFESIKDLDGISSFQLASDLVECDKDKPMPPVLFEFIVRCCEEAIRDGNDYAMNDLGALYYDGRECSQDFAKAIHYYRMAADKGNELALENLGYCYYYGRSVPVDYKKAFWCFAPGAFCGRLVSLYKIGDMYRKGYHVRKNPKEAFRIYSRCLELMTSHDKWNIAGPVYLRLGMAYLHGEGTEKSPSDALGCLQNAERYLYGMVVSGGLMYKHSLQLAIDGQAQAREELARKLPPATWP